MLHRKRRKRTARSEFDQNSSWIAIFVVPDTSRRFRETNGLAKMIRPVVVILSLLIRHPLTSDGRQNRKVGRRKLELFHELCIRLNNLFHHG